jgi:transcription elongation factor GreA
MSQSTEQGAATIWLTAGAHEKLKGELDNLQGPVRDEIVARISEARDEGDLKENGGYHAAREEQGKNEANITRLKEILDRAVSDQPADDGVVSVGKVVTYKFEGDDDDEAERFLLGARENEDYVDVEVFSPQAPLGEALLGATKGDTVAFEAPTGKTLQVVVLDATPYTD